MRVGTFAGQSPARDADRVKVGHVTRPDDGLQDIMRNVMPWWTSAGAGR